MYKNLLSWLTILLVLPSCSGTSPTISVVCEENNVGNCIIKWETAPILKGQVKIYASTAHDFIPEDNPVDIINISKGKKTIVTDDPSQRYYYLMVFNNKYRVKVAARNVNIPGIQNFRDLGGYKSSETGKVTRWGMLYRSAQIDSIPFCSRRELKNIGIRTIIDMRSGRSALICTTIRAKSTAEFSKIRCRERPRTQFLRESQDRLQWTNFRYRKRPNIRSAPAKDPNGQKPATDR